MNIERAKTALESVAFWRGATLILLSFIVGNGTSYLVFGLHTATKMDVQQADAAQTARTVALEGRIGKMEQAFNYLAGELHEKGIDNLPPPQ